MTGHSANCKMKQPERVELMHLALHTCISMHRISNRFFTNFFWRPGLNSEHPCAAQLSSCITMCTAEPCAELAGLSWGQTERFKKFEAVPKKHLYRFAALNMTALNRRKLKCINRKKDLRNKHYAAIASTDIDVQVFFCSIFRYKPKQQNLVQRFQIFHPSAKYILYLLSRWNLVT